MTEDRSTVGVFRSPAVNFARFRLRPEHRKVASFPDTVFWAVGSSGISESGPTHPISDRALGDEATGEERRRDVR